MPQSPSGSSQSKSPGNILVNTLLSPDLLAAIPDAVVAVDQQGKIVQVNPQTEQMFGYRRNELIGQGIELLVPDRFRQQHHHHRQEFVAAPNIRRMGAGLELYGKRRDGSEFPVEISLSPLRTEGGIVVLSAIRDVSDHKRMEAELTRTHEELQRRKDERIFASEAQLAAIVDSSQDAIIGKNLDGIVTHWNRGAERIYGYRAQEMIGKNIAELAPEDRKGEITQILERIRRGESVVHFESIRVAKNGRQLNVSISVSPIRNAGDEIIGASTIARDITDQKRAESQLRQAQKMEAIGRLAGGIAHDFNNILGIITACTELLRDRIAADEPQQFVDTIRKAADRGASLTRQLLAFSRKRSAQPQVLDLNELLREVNKLLRPLMGDDVEIRIVPGAEQALVEADPSQLDQIVLNLAVNARDAMPQGGKLIVETGAVDFDETFARMHGPMTPGKYVLLSVSDTGSGMDESTVARIFEPFFTTKETGKGTGLGLAVVYGIVKQSGGHIRVYSEPGRGTTFKIYLPSAEEKLGITEDLPEEAKASTHRGTGTILLVEDDDMMRSLTRRLLDEQGYKVLEASNGKSALELAASNHAQIDLLLTDVVMRGLSGPELVLRLSESRPATRVVFMSGFTGELIAEHDGAIDGVALLEKPFTRASLLKTIQAALE